MSPWLPWFYNLWPFFFFYSVHEATLCFFFFSFLSYTVWTFSLSLFPHFFSGRSLVEDDDAHMKVALGYGDMGISAHLQASKTGNTRFFTSNTHSSVVLQVSHWEKEVAVTFFFFFHFVFLHFENHLWSDAAAKRGWSSFGVHHFHPQTWFSLLQNVIEVSEWVNECEGGRGGRRRAAPF